MTPTKTVSVVARFGLSILAVLVLLPGSARAVGTCNGFINIDYPQIVEPPFPACTDFPGFLCSADTVNNVCACCLDLDQGDTIAMEITVGAGDILFGTRIDLFDWAVQPDCQAFVPGGTVCLARPGGPRIEWVDDTTITTTCGVSWTTGLAPGTPITSPQSIILAATPPPLIIPENSPIPPGLCSVRFDMRVVADYGDTIFQLARYNGAACDNGELVTGGAQTSKISVCPKVGPFVGYEIKRQGVKVATGGSMDVPALGIAGAPVPAMESLTGRRLLTPALPGNVFGEHLVAFSDFDLPLPNPKPTITVTTVDFPLLTGKLGGRSFVVINALKDLNVQPPPPPLTKVWACYGFEKALGPPVAWEDQFGPMTGKLRGTKRICFPASLLGTTPPDTPYLCARNEPDGRAAPKQRVFIASAWLNEPETLEGVDDYCVPATVTVSP